MGLSDADRAAMLRLRAARDEMAPSLWGDLERVLLLAGLEPEEPASGTFWLDEGEGELWVRDDMAATGENDLDRWWCTGNGAKFSWIQVCQAAPKLVELVRADEAPVVLHAALRDLRARAEAMHVKLHGPKPAISGCTSGPCYMMWRGLCDHGYPGGPAEGVEE